MSSRKDDDAHKRDTHARWSEAIQYREWRFEQCGRCAWWIPLTGEWGLDWGACSNPSSPRDREVVFEHDACPAFEDAGDWITPDE